MAKDDLQYRRKMNSALDQELSEDELTDLHTHIEASDEAADEWDRMQQTDRLMRETPLAAPSPGFVSRVMTAISAMPVPDFANRQLGLGLALGLAAAAVISLPLLSVLFFVMLGALTDPGTLNTLLQTVVNAASYLISLGADIGSEIEAVVSNTPVMLALFSTIIPITLLWVWLFWTLTGGSQLVPRRQKSR